MRLTECFYCNEDFELWELSTAYVVEVVENKGTIQEIRCCLDCRIALREGGDEID